MGIYYYYQLLNLGNLDAARIPPLKPPALQPCTVLKKNLEILPGSKGANCLFGIREGCQMQKIQFAPFDPQKIFWPK